MQIITVCGLGCGTSLMLKMVVEDILAENGIDGNVEAWDLGSVKGRKADLFIASEELRANFEEIEGPKVFIKNLTDTEEIRKKIIAVIK